MYSLLPLLLTFLPTIHAQSSQKDFTGIGNIYVLNSSDWRTADPKSPVGCLDTHGKFINPTDYTTCGEFSRLPDYPWTLSTSAGNCTFNDESQPTNVDSHYGGSDHAWSCLEPFAAQIYDELYTIDGFPFTFLCFGDIACYYDAKRIPAAGEQLPLWQFRWGSHQLGITPGHVMLQLMWHKTGDLPKRESSVGAGPGPRVSLEGGLQIPLQGQKIRS